MCAGSVDGIVQTTIFCLRNGGKVATGKDTGRLGAASAQLCSVTDKVASSSSIFGETISGTASKALSCADNGIMAVANRLGCGDSLTNLAGKAGTKSVFGAVAQKAVNPLLIGAASIRVLNDDDQYAALIEEGCAMGLMFGAEKLMKTQRNNFYKLAESAADTIGEAAKSSGVKETLSKVISNSAKKFSNLTKGQKTAVKIGLELLFVVGSICAYSAGKYIGKKLSHRDKDTAKA